MNKRYPFFILIYLFFIGYEAILSLFITVCKRYAYNGFIIAILLINLPTDKVYSQEKTTYDEIGINLTIQQIGTLEITTLIQNQEAFIPVKEIFDFLKIKNSISSDYERIDGFFINPQATFEIDYTKQRIVFQGKTYDTGKEGLILTPNNLYLKSSYLGEIFGLDCVFNFRDLSITINTKLELPAIKEIRLQQMRKNLGSLKQEKITDTVIEQSFPLFSLGLADWSVTNSKTGSEKNSIRANLALGAMVAGGETTINLNFDNDPFTNNRNQYYRWRYVNNAYSVFRQATVGRIFPKSTSTILHPVNGFQLSNTPTTHKRSFGSYRISNTTEPGWTVELYVNNILVDFKKADASGFYTFDAPLVYGNSAIKLRFYGPSGEERTQEQNIIIPFNFLPSGQFEYQMSVGVVEDHQHSIFYRLDLNYGLNNRITIGTGAEYFSLANHKKPMPFLNSSIRINTKLLLSGEYTPGINFKGILNYRLPADLQLDLNYTKYETEQNAVRYSYLEERKASLSMPIRARNFNAFSRLNISQFLVSGARNTRAEFLVSAFVAGVSTNLTTYALFTNFADPFWYSNLSLTLRLPLSLRFTPHIQYEYTNQRLSMMKAEFEKSLGNIGFANVGYEKNMVNNYNAFSIGLRINLSFIETAVSLMNANGKTISSQSARGSLLYNEKINQLHLSRNSNLGKGGLTILSFLDLNYNGRHDKNEPKVNGLKLKLNSAQITRNKRDTTLSITGLEAYTQFILELETNSFDNIAWQLKNKSFSVTVEPNHFKLIEVPVTVAGEASGYVYNQAQEGLGRIIIHFYNRHGKLAGKTVTEQDGYFTFMGLAPGVYTASIDEQQLKKVKMTASPALPFRIKANVEGDMVDGLDFVLIQQ
jgi:hypothetical protein